MTDHRWVVLDLLDRQVIDSTQQPVGKVDDLEFATAPDGPPRLSAVLSGAEALGQRLGGALGSAMAGTARRMLLEPREGPRRVAWSLVGKLGYVLELTGTSDELDLVPALEVWLRANVVGPVPGSGR